MLLVLGARHLAFQLEQVPAASSTLQTLGAPVTFAEISGATHDDIVLDFDTGVDQVTPLLVPFIDDATR